MLFSSKPFFRPLTKFIVTLQRKLFFYLIATCFLLFFSDCQFNTSPDVSHIAIDWEVARFEHDLFQIDSLNYRQSLPQLAQQYPDFFPLFTTQIMNFGSPQDTAFQQNLLEFVQNKDMRELYDSCQTHFPDFAPVEAELAESFRYFKHYLPHRKVPNKLISHLSAFGPAAVTLDSLLLGVNLDMFLGKDFPYYDAVNFPRYLSRRFTSEHLPAHVVKAYCQGIFSFDGQNPQTRLIDHIVYEGKLLYLLDLFLPQTADSLKIGYTADQMAWCRNSEAQIWAFFIDQELLYESDTRTYFKFVNEGPTTSGMPPESPARVGIWLGWQIVRSFMQKNPTVSVESLMKIVDGQQILARSAYKPRKAF